MKTIYLVQITDGDCENIPDIFKTKNSAYEFMKACLVRRGININDMHSTISTWENNLYWSNYYLDEDDGYRTSALLMELEVKGE